MTGWRMYSGARGDLFDDPPAPPTPLAQPPGPAPFLFYRGSRTALIFGPAPNPHGGPWTYDRRSAGRMAKMCGKKLSWYNIFETEPARWSTVEARRRAETWCQEHEREGRVPLLLLGTKVCSAFGIERPEWLEWYASQLWSPMIAFPHPSGLNRWWNSPENARRAGVLARGVARGRLPHKVWKNVEEDE